MSKISISGCLLLIYLLFVMGDALASERYQVVTHPGVQKKEISVNVLRAIFSMRMRTWSNGNLIRVFVLSDNDDLHHDFSKEKLNVFPYQLRLAWDRLVFSGTGQAPTLVNSQDDMLAKVANTPGAIGYLKTNYINDDVHVLHIK
ncbi:MAG: hypothetical protein OEX82_08695 [Nitrosomonas sp.]|nr:hypothetical protein [Nitrosomonas sp.]